MVRRLGGLRVSILGIIEMTKISEILRFKIELLM